MKLPFPFIPRPRSSAPEPRTIDADALLDFLNTQIDRWRDRECDGVNSHSYGVALSAACRATAFEYVRGYVLRDQADRVYRAASEEDVQPW